MNTKFLTVSLSLILWVPTCVQLFADPISAVAAVALETARIGGGVEAGRGVLLAVPGFLQLVDLLLRTGGRFNAFSIW